MGRHRGAGRATQASRMAKGGGLNIIGAVIQQAALLAVIAVIAKVLGKSAVGQYSECYALLSLLGLMSLAGFRAGLTRYVAVYLADADPARVRGTIRLGMGVSVISSFVIGGALAVAAPQVAGFFHDPNLVLGIRLMGLALPAATISDAALSATQGWRTQGPYTYIGRIWDPLFLLASTCLALWLGKGLDGVFWATALAPWTTAALASLALLKRMRTVPPARPVMEPREIFGFSMVSWLSTVAQTGMTWAGTIILGNMATAAEVGVFNVSTRLVTLAVFVMAPITNAFSPHMAHLYHIKAKDQAARAYGDATRWIVFISTPAFVMLLVYPRELLHLFGKDFTTGAAVTVILACGQFMVTATGPCGVVLNMSGRVLLSLVDNVAVLILNVALMLWLTPRYGMVGAASAWSFSLIAVNVTKVIQAHHIVGIAATGARVGRAILAGIPAFAVAWVVRLTVPHLVPSLIVGTLATGLVYLGAQVLIGIHPDDRRLALGALRQAGLARG